jgi:hypothetical protein
MKILRQDIHEDDEEEDGSITFEFEGYVYYIGQLDGPPGWFSRMKVEDYENDGDNWESPSGWSPEKIAAFKLLRNIYE